MKRHRTKNAKQYIATNLRGEALLRDPQLNKGTAFTLTERKTFNLLGRLPQRVETLTHQVSRAYTQLNSYTSLNKKSLFLNELYNINQVLFYKLVEEHIAEIAPIIYTPQVAVTCQTFSPEFRHPYGLYISYPDRNNLAKIVDNYSHEQIDLLVVTDSQRILGIGDQGVGGIGIPIGKLILYTIFGGIDYRKTLPVVLDVGTDNQKLLNDPMYLGWRHSRITGSKYLNFIDDFIAVIHQKMPNVLLQWEDFGKVNAPLLLKKYQKTICSFNDDIQGTAVVTLAAILAAIKITRQKLTEQRIVILGAGSAALGIVDLIVAGIQRQGLTKQQAYEHFWLLDSKGLLTEKSTTSQKAYLRKTAEIDTWHINKKKITLLDVINHVKPTILIGCSTAANSFTQEIVQTMANQVNRPIILPLSNPTVNSEATPEDLIKWTEGRALIATGSPFAPVVHKNKKYVIAQCNNALTFPGLGLAVIASKAREVNEDMLWTAVMALYKEAPSLQNPNNPLLPPLEEAAKVAKKIALEVAAVVLKNRLTPLPATTDVHDLITKTVTKIAYKKFYPR